MNDSFTTSPVRWERNSRCAIEAPSTTVTRNTARHNRDLGIDAAPGVIDGGGNRASGNGNPDQCTNVVCR